MDSNTIHISLVKVDTKGIENAVKRILIPRLQKMLKDKNDLQLKAVR